MPGPSQVVAENVRELGSSKRDRAFEEPASIAALEHPEAVPRSSRPRPSHVGIGVPPSSARIYGDVAQRVCDLETTDEVEPWLVIDQSGEKDDGVTITRTSQAVGSAGATAVVAVGRRRRREVRIEVNGAIAPAAEHGRPPCDGFWDWYELESSIRAQGRADRVGRVHADVGEKDGHVPMLMGRLWSLGRMP